MQRLFSRPGIQVATGWAATFVSLSASLVVSPHLISSLSTNGYGVWVFIQGLCAFADLLYLGIGSFVVRQIALLSDSTNNAKLKQLTSRVLSLYVSLGVIAATLFLTLGGWATESVTRNYTDEEHLHSALLVVAATLLLTFVNAVYSGILAGFSRFSSAHAIAIGATILRTTLIITCIAPGDGILRLATIVLASQLAQLACLFTTVRTVFPNANPTFSKPDTPFLKEAYTYGLKAFLFTCYNKMIQYTDILVISIIAGPTQTALFSIPQQLSTYVWLLSTQITRVLFPQFSKLHPTQERENIRELYIATAVPSALVLATGTAAVICLAEPFVRAWIGDEYANYTALIITPLMVTTFLRAVYVQIPVSMLLAINLANRSIRILVLEGIVKMIVSLVLLWQFGIVAMCYGTLAVALVFDVHFISKTTQTHTGMTPWRHATCILLPCIVLFSASFAIFTKSADLLGVETIFQIAATATVGGLISMPIIYAFQSTIRARYSHTRSVAISNERNKTPAA